MFCASVVTAAGLLLLPSRKSEPGASEQVRSTEVEAAVWPAPSLLPSPLPLAERQGSSRGPHCWSPGSAGSHGCFL